LKLDGAPLYAALKSSPTAITLGDIQEGKNMDDISRKFHSECEAIRKTLTTSFYYEPKKHINLLHHYTDREGLRGIVGNKQLWATHIRYLNDEREVEHGLDIIKQIYSQRKGEADSKRIELYYEHNEKMIKDIFKYFDIYVVSFSEDSDMPNQWKEYTKPNDGYALSLDSYTLAKQIAAGGPTQGLYCIFYEEEKQKDIMNKLLDIMETRVRTDNTLSEEDIHDAAIATNGYFCFLIPSFKSIDWKVEREWRCIYISNHEISKYDPFTRKRNGKEIPYFIMNIASGFEDLITHITISPSTSRAELDNVMDELSPNLSSKVVIKESKVRGY